MGRCVGRGGKMISEGRIEKLEMPKRSLLQRSMGIVQQAQ